mmetsp:Transcript_22609/g.66411  ORF Transcript_22609/g.66411 Transcript_22609/m.66411 type:complete len:323 (-) Transcript_22609:47-1015(-)
MLQHLRLVLQRRRRPGRGLGECRRRRGQILRPPAAEGLRLDAAQRSRALGEAASHALLDSVKDRGFGEVDAPEGLAQARLAQRLFGRVVGRAEGDRHRARLAREEDLVAGVQPALRNLVGGEGAAEVAQRGGGGGLRQPRCEVLVDRFGHLIDRRGVVHVQHHHLRVARGDDFGEGCLGRVALVEVVAGEVASRRVDLDQAVLVSVPAAREPELLVPHRERRREGDAVEDACGSVVRQVGGGLARRQEEVVEAAAEFALSEGGGRAERQAAADRQRQNGRQAEGRQAAAPPAAPPRRRRRRRGGCFEVHLRGGPVLRRRSGG